MEWRTGQELANAVTELVDVLAQGTEGLDRAIIRLQAGIEAPNIWMFNPRNG
ncbi:hypothetical protein [Acaryochloris sp. CCMEE 5410]|uniref:hypothetical protein n=1 Tax=Acaryochloris sp. CCMEE 5410 TaxID=310037 RepID=UPI0021D2A409|nr:hypothetical protein [Acaryochloris sp. CCMEE 5410]